MRSWIRIRIRNKVKSRIRIRIKVKNRIQIRISIKEECRIRIRINVIWISNIGLWENVVKLAEFDICCHDPILVFQDGVCEGGSLQLLES
jgi:hypothetical protein